MRSLILALCSVMAMATQATAQFKASKSAVIPNKGSFTDIKQGSAGTCWILSSIAAMENRGRHFENSIHYEGNNLYTVKVYNFTNPKRRPDGGIHSQTEWVYFDGTTTKVDARLDPKNPKSAWVVIMQRAVVQALHDWDPSQVIARPHSGYAGDALVILSGRSPKNLQVHDAKTKSAVESAMAARKVVVLNTTGKAKTLVPGHDYAVLSANDREVTLYNPWGSTLTVSWDLISREGTEFTVN